MSKALVEMAFCGVCGVDVRDESQFCYNCGFRFSNLSAPGETREKGGGETSSEPPETKQQGRASSGRRVRKANGRNALKGAEAAPLNSALRKGRSFLKVLSDLAALGSRFSPEDRLLLVSAALALVSLILVVVAMYVR